MIPLRVSVCSEKQTDYYWTHQHMVYRTPNYPCCCISAR